jgi:GDPmannose 4,6-dehydratase
MKTALITGISGQDGSYLAELLLAREYRVIGTSRDPQTSEQMLPLSLRGKVKLVGWNMRDQNRIVNILSEYRPTELYNLASFTSGAGMFDGSIEIGEINGLAVARILDAIRVVDENIRFCQASSREIFGEALESPQSEQTPRHPRSPYGAAKLYADSMIRIYRERHKSFACCAILFNHESPRRGRSFVTRKITYEAARIKLGLSKELQLGNLDTKRDWGFAGDFVHAMWLMLQQPAADDYVVATGKVHSVREFCDRAFANLGLDYKAYVRQDAASYRPAEHATLVGDIRKAQNLLGWQPLVEFHELVAMMTDADLRDLENHAEPNR